MLLILTLGSGFAFYNLSVYMTALADERGFSIASLSFAISLFFVATGIGGLLVARLLEWLDVRLIMTGGAFVVGTALVLAGRAGSEIQLLWVYFLFGAGYSCLSLVPVTTLVARWFPGENRSMALAVATTGFSLGGLLITPWCVAWIHSNGIELALTHFGVIFAVLLLPLIWGFVRLPPAVPVVAVDGERPAETGWDRNEALGSRFFILLTAAFFLIMGAQVGSIAHLFNRATLLADREVAATAVQLLAVASVTGRLAGGWLLSVVPTRLWLLLNVAGQALGLGVLAFASSALEVWVGAVLFGLTVGNLLMLQPLVLVESFGLRSYASIYALANAATTVGVASGPLLLGTLFEYGGYELAYGVASGLCVAAILVLLVAGDLPDSREGGLVQATGLANE